MKHIIDSVGSALVIAAAALVASAPQAQEQAARPAVARNYEVVDLGTHGPPGLESYATHINAAGMVVGVVRTRPENANGIPVIFQLDQAPVPLNDRIGQTAGLNALGEVTGNVETASGGYEPFFWKDGVTTIVPSPAGTQSFLEGINDSSVAVGSRHRPGS
jgi:uncharacterized membrane protein